MRIQLKNKIKAFTLLMVFSLNTVLGFACSVGLDMGFNSKHHRGDGNVPIVHVHKNGKRHTHSEKKGSHSHGHHHGDKYQESKEDKGNCCNDEVVQFEKLDKITLNSFSIIHPLFLTAFIHTFYNTSLPGADIVKNIKQFVRSYHPPIPDIRIAIQSFQI